MDTINFLGVKKRRPRLSLYLAAMATLAALLLTVIPVNAETIVCRSIDTGTVPVAMAVNPVTNKIYVVGSNTTVIDGATNKPTTVPVAGNSLAINPATNKIYVVNTSSDVTMVIDGATNSITRVTVGSSPKAVAVNPVTNKIYVVGSNTTVIDGATNNTTTVGAGGNSLAVNPATNKIYVANGNGTVTVIDGATNSTTRVTVGSSPSAVAVNPVTNKIYVANYVSNTVTVIDGATNNTTTVTAGTGPKFIAVNPVTNKIYVFNQGVGLKNTTVTVIDGATNGTFTLGCTGTLAQAIVVNPANNRIYVANYDIIMIIDGATNTTTTMTYNSYAMAVNPVTNKLYVIDYNYSGSTSGSVSVIDCATNSTTTVPVGLNPSAVAVNPATNKTYVANYTDGTVTVIDGVANSTYTVTGGTGPKDIAVNPGTNKIYAVNSISNNVTVIDGATNSTTTVAAGTNPLAVAVNPSTNQIYVANYGSNNITVIDGVTNSTTTVAVGTSPSAMAVNQATNKIYVANSGSNNVTVIDGATNSTTKVAVGTSPSAVAVNPVTNKIYVANTGSNTVTVIDAVNNTTTVTVGTSPKAVAVNPATNKIYVANYDSRTVSVIDGITNKITTTVNVQVYSWVIAVNPATNQIYTDSYSGVQVIDGPTNYASYVDVAEFGKKAIAVNPATNKIYVANYNGSNVTIIDVQPVPDINPLVNIAPLTNNVITVTAPDFTFSASGTSALPVQHIWYQVDSLTGIWQQASPAGSSANATLPSLSLGTHILYAMATDGQDATSINTGFSGSPVTGKIATYTFTVVPAAVTPNINTQPQNRTQDTHDVVAFSVGAKIYDGGTLSYQWQISTDNGGTWNNISGATNASYTTGTVNISDNGTQYRCTVTNTKYDSAATAISNVATLKLLTYTKTYDGNGNTGGSVPVDHNTYLKYDKVTVLGNLNNLVKTGYVFAGWNTQADGSGTTYNAGSTFTINAANVALYAEWTLVSLTLAADQVLTDTNLAATNIRVALTGTTLKDNSLNIENFILLGASSLNITSVTFVDNTHCTLRLTGSLNGTINLGLTIKAAEISNGSDLTSVSTLQIIDDLPDGKETLIIGTDGSVANNIWYTAENYQKDYRTVWNGEALYLGKGVSGRNADLWLYNPGLIGNQTGQIPTTAKIDRAELVLKIKDISGGMTKPRQIKIYQITDPDNKGKPYFGSEDGLRTGLNFLYRDHRLGRNIPWSTDASDITAICTGDTLLDTFEFIPKAYQEGKFSSIRLDISDAVKAWVGNTNLNQGLYITIEGTTWDVGEQVEMYGATATDVADRPKLRVTYLTTGNGLAPNPVTLNTSPNDGEVDLSWTWTSGDTTHSTTTGCRIVRKYGVTPADPSDGVLVYDGPNLAVTDTGLENGKIYYYAAFAYDTSRNYSSKVCQKAVPCDDSSSPAVPTGLTYTLSGRNVTLSWTDNATNEDKYLVYRDSNYLTPIATLNTNQTTYCDWNVAYGTHTYQVQAKNSVGPSDLTMAVSVSVPNLPDAPADLAWSIISSSEVQLLWTISADTTYRVEILDSDGNLLRSETVTTNLSTDATKIQYPVMGLTVNVSYRFRVVAINAYGENAAETELIKTAADPKPIFF